MKIKLYAPTVGVMEFEKAHAERILAKDNNGGWVLHIEKKVADSGNKRNSGNTKKSKK